MKLNRTERKNLQLVEYNDRSFINVIRWSAESESHFTKKCKICYHLKRMEQLFITECKMLDSGRVVDIFNLTTGDKIELEMDESEVKPDADITFVHNAFTGWRIWKKN